MLTFGVAALVVSCTEEKKIPTYELSGTVKNTTLQGVKIAQVELVKNGTVLYSAVTDNLGVYTVVAEEGEYTLRVNVSGYTTYTETINLTANNVKNITLLGTANVSGRILNSQTGDGLANATIKLNRLGDQKTLDETWEIIVTTDNDGYYFIVNGPIGNFYGVISAEGFIDRVITNIEFITGINDIDDETIVSPPAEGELRIVLNWGEYPSDLDSHITGPDGYGGRFHVCYFNMQESGVSLDVDDVSSFGPETITIGSFYTGTYRYSVHNYSNQYSDGGMGIYNSPTRVEIYDHNGLVQSFIAPVFQSSDNGNTWRVFEIDFANGTATIRTINTYVYADSSSDTDIFKNQSKEKVKLQSKDF
jgi:hypothetical protein